MTTIAEVNEGNFKPEKMVSGWAPPTEGLPKHLAEEPTVTMVFPHKVSLQLDEGMGLVHFEKGIREVPRSLASDWMLRREDGTPVEKHAKPGMHWYLRQNGVVVYDKPEDPIPEITESHIDFLKSQGHNVSSIVGVRQFVETLNSEQRRTFFAAAAWQKEQQSPLDISAQMPVILTDKHVAFLQSRGYAVSTIEGTQTFVGNLSPMDRAGFMAECADWSPKNEDPDDNPDPEVAVSKQRKRR